MWFEFEEITHPILAQSQVRNKDVRSHECLLLGLFPNTFSLQLDLSELQLNEKLITTLERHGDLLRRTVGQG